MAAIGLTALVAAVAMTGASSSASAHSPTTTSPPPVVAGSTYLALGDSVAFGYRESATSPRPDYNQAGSFVGYPGDIGRDLGLKVTNAACPGETTSSFIDTAAVSNGCETNPDGAPGYRSTFPLHVAYSGSQLAYAESFLETHRDTRLVTLDIGENDVLICDGIANTDGCSSELPRVLSAVEDNVATILSDLRRGAGYDGQIVLLDYYLPDPGDATASQYISYLNGALDAAAAPYDVEIAHGNAAFGAASKYAGGHYCTAGLLTQLTGPAKGACGIHPSPAGQDVLAQAVATAIAK
jgi:lysophospholipase L1-like esterase